MILCFDPPLPKPAYSRLPDGKDCSEPPSPTARPLVRRFFCSRHRFIFFLVVLCLLFVFFLPLIRYTELSDVSVFEKWNQELDEKIKFGPILGSDEDSSRLYFPPIGQDFRPYVAPYNHPPDERPRTPLFIPFTRNNDMLRQAVLAWIAVGWPREDIIVVDNTGTMDANNEGMLSVANPFFIDYPLYRTRYGVAILQTPTLFNFAQLQNFFLRLAIAERWPYFFWSHMDIGVLSDEVTTPYQSFYTRVLSILSAATTNTSSPMPTPTGPWALKLFSFDNLALVNVAAWRLIGPWDTFIPYYHTDCDAYARLAHHNLTRDAVSAGFIYDLAAPIAPTRESLEAALFPANATDANDPDNFPNSPRHQRAAAAFAALQAAKLAAPERNTWQAAQGAGGRGEAWTYDPRGFQRAWWATAACGRALFAEKWGTARCGLVEEGVGVGDAWREEEGERRGAVGG